MKHLLPFLIAFAAILPLKAQVLINEYSAANLNSFTDNFGEYEDWIELYNAGPTMVNLAGYYLSDKLDEPTKWQFPTVNIPANGYLVIFASKLDITTGPSLHTNFNFTQTASNEAVVLADPSGTVIDFYQIFVPNKAGHSTGRITNGAATWGVFTTPTPNAANNNSKKGMLLHPMSHLIQVLIQPQLQFLSLRPIRPMPSITPPTVTYPMQHLPFIQLLLQYPQQLL